MRELTGAAEVVAASADDDLIVWAAQGMKPGVRAWVYGDAIAVASPRIARRDRLVIRGDLAHVIPLVRHALAEVGPSFRPLGDAALVHEVARAIDELRPPVDFSWMSTRTPARPNPPRSPAPASASDPCWLDADEEPEVADLLKEANPDSYAFPGRPGIRRWAGIRDSLGGALLAVAADAWSTPGLGLIAGVATAVSARRRGLGERVCRFVMEALLAEHGRVALMVDDGNHTAIGIYRRLGFVRRRIAATGIVV